MRSTFLRTLKSTLSIKGKALRNEKGDDILGITSYKRGFDLLRQAQRDRKDLDSSEE